MLSNEVRSDTGDFSLRNMLHRISVDRYHAMIASGIFNDDDRIELIDGMIIEKMPKSPLHSTITWLLKEILQRFIPDQYYVDSQEPITTEDSEPEPDIFIVRGSKKNYFTAHPNGADVPLVIEVSDSTLQRDQTLKLSMYARSSVAEYWIVNVQAQQIEVYRSPSAQMSTYDEKKTYGLQEKVPVNIDGIDLGEFDLFDIFPDQE